MFDAYAAESIRRERMNDRACFEYGLALPKERYLIEVHFRLKAPVAVYVPHSSNCRAKRPRGAAKFQYLRHLDHDSFAARIGGSAQSDW